MYVSFIAKKSSKSKKLIDKIIERLHQQNITEKHLVEFTEYAGHAVDLAEGLARKKVDVVVAVGGDGTLNEVLNGIMRVSANVILALIPMGTANDFSKTIGVNKNVDQFISLIKNNMIRTIDIGKVTCLNKGGEIERYFINIADAGLGGQIGPNLNEIRPDKMWVINTVTNGIGVMPAYEGELTSEEIEAVAHYVSISAAN